MKRTFFFIVLGVNVFSAQKSVSQNGICIGLVRNHIDKNVSLDYFHSFKNFTFRGGIKYHLKFDDEISFYSYKQRAAVTKPLDYWGLNLSISRNVFTIGKAAFGCYSDFQITYGSFLHYSFFYAGTSYDSISGTSQDVFYLDKFFVPDKFTIQANIGLDFKFEIAPWIFATQRIGGGIMFSDLNELYEARSYPGFHSFDWDFIFVHYQAGLLFDISQICKTKKN